MNYLKKSQNIDLKRKCIVSKNPCNDPEDEICLICYQIIIQPVSCSKCRGSFCKICAQNWKKIQNRCPKKCSEQNWKLSDLDRTRYNLKCPYSEFCKEVIAWNDWNHHLLECPWKTQEVRKRIRLMQQRLCEKEHRLTHCLHKSAKCTDCENVCNCLMECTDCKEKFCVSCRLPDFHRTVCPNLHKLQTKKLSFTCVTCHKDLPYQICHHDTQCSITICRDCYITLPSYPNEDQILRSFRWGRKYSM